MLSHLQVVHSALGSGDPCHSRLRLLKDCFSLDHVTVLIHEIVSNACLNIALQLQLMIGVDKGARLGEDEILLAIWLNR